MKLFLLSAYEDYVLPLSEIFMVHPIIKWFLGIMVALFSTEPILLMMVGFAAVIDTIFGAIAAVDKGDFNPRKIFGGFITKCIRYGLVIALLVMPINVFGGVLTSFIPVIFGILWANEAVSAIQHIKDPALKRSLVSILNSIKKGLSIPEDGKEGE